MKLFFKIFVFILCCSFLLLNAAAYENSIDQIICVDREITVRGTIEDVNSIVTVMVLKPQKSLDDLETEYNSFEDITTNLDSIQYYDESITDKSGNFEFRILMPEEAVPNDYLVLVRSSGGSKKLYSGILRFITMSQKVDAIRKINAALLVSKQELFDKIENNNYTLSLFINHQNEKVIFDNVGKTDLFYNILKGFGTYPDSIETINESIQSLYDNVLLSTVLSNITNLNNIIELKDYLEYYKNILKVDLSKINQRNSDFIYDQILKVKAFNSSSDLQNLIDDSLFFHIIKNAMTWGEIKGSIENYGEKYALDIENKNVDYNKVYHEMFDNRLKYQSKEDIINDFNNLARKYPKTLTESNPPSRTPSGSGGVISAPIASQNTEVKTEKEMNFADVEENFWAYDDIKFLYKKGIVSGKTDEKFYPNDFITREEFVALIVRAFGKNEKSAYVSFKDVETDKWYYEPVSIAYNLKIIKGISDDTFGIGNNITRQDMAVIAYNALKAFNLQLKTNNSEIIFSDEANIFSYAKEAVRTMQKAGILNGYKDGSFYPSGYTSRAEAVHIISLLLKL